MHEQAIAIYCVCEEVIRFFGLNDDPQCKMTTSEVMTFALNPDCVQISLNLTSERQEVKGHIFRYGRDLLPFNWQVQACSCVTSLWYFLVLSWRVL